MKTATSLLLGISLMLLGIQVNAQTTYFIILDEGYGVFDFEGVDDFSGIVMKPECSIRFHRLFSPSMG
jgi:hypothetical protein